MMLQVKREGRKRVFMISSSNSSDTLLKVLVLYKYKIKLQIKSGRRESNWRINASLVSLLKLLLQVVW